MKPTLTSCATIVAALFLSAQLYAQPLTGYNFRIVNMIPNLQSNETNFDAETNIAVNPANTSVIAGSAFTSNATGAINAAPIFISTNGGTTWALNNIVPSGNGMTGDISLGFASTSGNLYTGILRGGSGLRAMMLRTNTPAANTMMTTLADRNTVQVDQPFVSAMTVNAGAVPRDRLFSGDNLFGNKLANGGNGRTAEVMFSNNAGATPFGGFTNEILEERNTVEQDMPATRMAIHNSGVVYGVFYSWQSGSIPNMNCDVVIVRDDNFATGAVRFGALQDGGNAGRRIVTNRLVPAFGVSLGNNRLVASNLAIAVDPNNSANVFVAWCDRVGASDYTLHLRRSTNSGQNWSNDLITITNATNPGIAITTGGAVGFIYQQLTGAGASARWETHFRLSPTITGNTYSNDILSTFLSSDLVGANISPSLGDYLDIQAVNNTFYGVFPASNRPVMTNFPHSVTYQRNANFNTNQLRNSANTANVAVSVDPFFFRISPRLRTICDLIPDLCPWRFIDKMFVRIPKFFCPRCPPGPCLTCPPFEIPFEDIFKEAFKTAGPKTTLVAPYFHLRLDNYDPSEFDIQVVNEDGMPLNQQLNKSEKGYTISFHPSKNNYNAQQGIHGLKLTIVPKTEAARAKEVNLGFDLKASDYQFKEFTQNQK